ncbi:ataxin-1-like [Conger conger]|uniref:ataxin-1-like n=1 Tax=Conger conger TaxID=82655 RepID=UPI002A5A567A|nr:ataxin-1-like [Conger conger]
MKPAHERSQECLPPKKRDLAPSGGGGVGGGFGGVGGAADGAPGEWPRLRPETGLGLTPDPCGLRYEAADPPGGLHPALSHVPPAASLLRHPGTPYPPLGYAHLPPSSVQFVGPPYAVPYAARPGYLSGPLVPPQPPAPPARPLPYASVIQGVAVSPPPRPPVELSPRAAPVFYPHPGPRGHHHSLQGRPEEVNGAQEDPRRGGRESPRDPWRLLDPERPQDRTSHRFQARGSPAVQRAPSDTDLEGPVPVYVVAGSIPPQVQQAGAQPASPDQVVTGGCKEAAVRPLNLSQGAQREREALQAAYAPPLSVPGDPRGPAQHTVVLANGQPVLVPLDYHPAPPDYHPAPLDYHPAPPDNNNNNDDDVSVNAAPPASHPPDRSTQSPLPPPAGPSHFSRGAIIQLATGELRRVEDLRTQDFLRSAEASGGLRVDSSTVADVRGSARPGLVELQFAVGGRGTRVAIDVPPEHPFFVFGRGWSSCCPDRTARLYGLDCQRLRAGDVCVSIALQQPKPPPSRAPAPPAALHPMGPPAPHHPRPAAHCRERGPRDRDEERPLRAPNPAPPRPDSPAAEHGRGRSGYLVHRGGAPQRPATPSATALRHRPTPGLQKYPIKSEEAPSPSPCPSLASSGSLRPPFVPPFVTHDVKLSIEGRSNAGK